jgi:hypothetical protein
MSAPPHITETDIAISYPETKEQLLRKAMHRFYDVNQTDSLLNILEAQQTVSSAYAILRDLRAILSGKFPSLTGSIANHYLGWSFGFAPLIADIKALSRELPKLRGRLRKLAKDATASHTVSAYCNGTIAQALAPSKQVGYSPVPNPTPFNGTWWHCKVLPTVVPCLRVGVRGKRAIEYNTNLFQEADYLLSRFIATGPASLAWEKVKFSFVIDWFVDLTGLIDFLDNSLVGSSKKIEKCWWSEKYSILIPCYKHTGWGVGEPLDGQQVALSSVQYYHREPLSPDLSIGWSGRFGKKQGGLSLALFYQMIANLRKSR